jgi:hypothetical protein
MVVQAQGRSRSSARTAGDPCEDTAAALLNAATHEAESDYWVHVANCLNDPDVDPTTCEGDAAAERDDALELAEEQHDARVALCNALGGGAYAPDLDPAEFSTRIDNRLMPMIPGVLMIYEKQGADGDEIVQVRALKDTVDIDGFKCRVIHDVSRLDGALNEDTLDFVAQRSDGTVWYFGEVSQSFDDGFLDSLEGSWRTGKDGGKPGILMEAAPQVGDLYRQEFMPAVAEDVATVLSLDETVTVPAGTFLHCLKTEERTPMEPDHVEWKYYALDVGLVLTIDVETGEREELIKIRR